MKSERAPWGDFPKAITNGTLGELDKQPQYQAAKSGDKIAAWELVSHILKDKTVEEMLKTFNPNQNTLLVPVLAQESAGKNKIPLAVARFISKQTGLNVSDSILQVNHVGRTNKNADSRLVFQPIFKGKVEPFKYILIDDTLTMGGTLAALRGHINNNGGQSIGMLVMCAQQRSLQLAPSEEVLDNIYTKHGKDIEQYWRKEFGYEINELTQAEAEHIRSIPNAHTLRARITQARYVGGLQLDGRTTTPEEQKAIQLAKLTQEIQAKHHPKAIISLDKRTSPCRGLIVAQTDDFIIQQVNEGSRYFQAHAKKDLPYIPAIGEKPNISYSPKESQARIRAQKLKRSR